MFRFSGTIDRRAYLVAAAWRFGLFIAFSILYPVLLIGLLQASTCGSVGGACGALGVVISMFLKPAVFLAFVASMTGISVRRVRDLGLSGWVGLIVPLMLLADWRFGVLAGTPWGTSFVLGGIGFITPYFFLTASACVVFLCCVSSDDVPLRNPQDRFGPVGVLALAMAAFVAAVAILQLLAFGLPLGPRIGVLGQAFRLLMLGTVVKFAMLLLAGSLAYLLFQDRIGRRPDSAGGPGGTAPGRGGGRTPAPAVFGKRGR